jgi:putative membrane protein
MEVIKMTGHEFCGGYWWIFPLAMFIFCFFFMRIRSGKRMCGWNAGYGFGESALDILNKRYAKGEIDKSEYEEKKGNLI